MIVPVTPWSVHLQLVQWASSLQLTAVRTALVFLAVLLATRWLLARRKGLSLPPGPLGLPVVGYLLFLGKKNYHLKLTELGKKFGPVYQVFFGRKRCIVVSDPHLVRDAFRQPVFSGRPGTELTKIMEGYGIINTDGALWKEQRSFLHGVLREFGAKGACKAALEENIQTQVNELLSSLEKLDGAPHMLRLFLARAVSNVVGTMLMSVSFEKGDVGFERLLYLIDEGFRLFSLAVPVNFVPVLRYIPLWNGPYQQIKKNKAETASYFMKVTESHRKTLDENIVRDFVDAFLLQEKRVKDSGKSSFFSEEQLLQVMGDIFSAGIETVTCTLEWAILFMVINHDVQKRVQEELDEVVGRERLPCLDDIAYLPYTEATVLEVLRRASVIALGNAHATLHDTELGGFFIPKDSHILPNLWAIHMDSDLWEFPERFMPERFIQNGKVVKPNYFMPFSVGRRMCVGDNLTKMEVFLFLSSLLHKFDLFTPEEDGVPTLEPDISVAMKPKPFRVCAAKREE